MKLDRYQTEAGIVCIITSFANVLSYVGKPIDDSTLFLLGDGFVLDYSMEQAQSIKDIILHHYSNSAIYRFFNRYGIPMSIAPFAIIWKSLKIELVSIYLATSPLLR